MPRLADRIIEILYDRQGQSVWRDELLHVHSSSSRGPGGSGSGTSERAVEAALEELAQRGHRIEQTPSGLRLAWPTVLDAHLIERNLPARRIGKHVICFGEVGSTSDVAFDAAVKASPGEAMVVTAESQKAGRGRLGRKWVSPAGSGILCSIALAGCRAAHEPLTIAAGLAVAQGVEDAGGVHTELEWPNDVACDGAKLAGVLVEVRQLLGRGVVVIGLGVNVSAAPPAKSVGRKTTCLAECGGRTTDRIAVLRAILVRMDYWLTQIESGDVASLHEQWLPRCGMMHQRITIECAGQRITGRVADVNPLQGLVVVDDAGKNHVLPASSSSVVR